jgi:predicted dienelactone hydrolase
VNHQSSILALACALAACGGGNNTEPLVDASGDPPVDGEVVTTDAIPVTGGATSGRTLPATIYTPSAPGPHPLVIVSPGFQMARTQYASYAHHLATWGFVAILTDYADTGFFADHQKLANDVTAVIDFALARTDLAIAPAQIATAGHSLGGKISIFAAAQDARIRAVVAWDPVDSNNPSVAPQKMTGMTAAIAVAGETTNGAGGGMPCAPTADNFQQFYAASPTPALALTVNGADHMDWVDDPSCTFCSFCSPGTASPDLARTVSRRLDVAWLRRQLLADAAMDPWLTNPPELAGGSISLVRK